MWSKLFIAGNLYLRAIRAFSAWNHIIFSGVFWGSFGKIISKEGFVASNALNDKYDDQEIASCDLEKYLSAQVSLGHRERQLLLPLFFCLHKLKTLKGRSQYTFGDLGGGFGIHFDLIRNYLSKDEILSYYIIETPSLCKAYEENPKLHTDNRKKFFTLQTYPYKTETDIFLAIGSLQSMEDWKSVLAPILSNTNCIIFDCLPLIDGDTDVYSRQYARRPIYTRSTSYPITYISRSNFESFLKENNFQIEFSHEDTLSASTLNFKHIKNYTYCLSKVKSE